MTLCSQAAIYADTIDRAFLSIRRVPPDAARKKLMETLQRSMDGKVVKENEELLLRNKQGELELTLLAEGRVVDVAVVLSARDVSKYLPGITVTRKAVAR